MLSTKLNTPHKAILELSEEAEGLWYAQLTWSVGTPGRAHAAFDYLQGDLEDAQGDALEWAYAVLKSSS